MARDPVQEEGSEAPLEKDGAPGHQVGDCFSLLLPSVPGKGTPKLPDLLCCDRMPTTKRLCHHWDKSNSLLVALLSGASYLPVVGDVQGIAWCGGCTCPGSVLEGVGHCHIKSSIPAACPVWNEDICRPKRLHMF